MWGLFRVTELQTKQTLFRVKAFLYDRVANKTNAQLVKAVTSVAPNMKFC